MHMLNRLLSTLTPLVLATFAQGEVVVRHVPSEYPSINIAVGGSKSGDIIKIAAGAYYENVMVVGKGLTFLADGEVTVYPKSDGPVFTVNDNPQQYMVEFNGLTITTVVQSGRVPHGIRFDNGHAIQMENAWVQVTACRFIDCSVGYESETVSQSGAAIDATLSHVWVEESWFVNCRADYGGAIACIGGTLDIRESIFTGNYVDYDGGSVISALADVTLNQVRFVENWAGGQGGHLTVYGGTLFMKRSRFTEGFAVDGGAVMVQGYWGSAPTASMQQCRFENNVAFSGTDVWKQTAGLGPYMFNATYCGTNGSQGGILPAWQLPVTDSCDACISDADFDETTDMRDLLDVLEHWGEMDPFTDLGGNGTTGHSDLQMVLWGYGGCLQLD